MKTDTSSMRSALATARPVLQLELSIPATPGCNAPILCSFWCRCSKPFCSLLPGMVVRSGLPQGSSHPAPQTSKLCSSFFFLRRACHVKKSVPVDIIFQELAVTHWHDFWWRRVLSFWSAMLPADSGSICSLVFHDSIALTQGGCSFGWAAQVCKCFMASPSR